MSDAVLNHGYTPEGHAPDPVISHGDPTPPGKVGIWLFLASEIMFFIGILGSYIVIRSGWPKMFEEQGRTLNKWLAGINTLVLIFSSLTMALAVDSAQKGNRPRLIKCLLATFLCALTFMVIKGIEYTGKFNHYTIEANQGGKHFVYDGHLDPRAPSVGVALAADKMEGGGFKIESVRPKSPAAVAGLKAGQVIASVDGKDIRDADDFYRLLHAKRVGDKVELKGKDLPAPVTLTLEPVRFLHGLRVPIANDAKFDIHFDGEEWVRNYTLAQRRKELAERQKKGLAGTGEKVEEKVEEHGYEVNGTVSQEVNYGPWKNLFFSCYFAATGVHGLHVLGGMIPLGILTVQAMRRKIMPAHTEYVGLYWHFVDLVWIFLFPLMYLI